MLENSKITYLSLGSNLGNRLENLQRAIDLIAQNVGQVQRIASVYKTTSWGFSSNDFYNTCVEVATYFAPEIVIKNLLSIEKQLGRTRKLHKKYADRIIDIDIILFGQQVIDSKKLVVPHPRMLARKFVLIPLAEIAKEVIHPLTKEVLSVCLANCSDTSSVLRLAEELYRPKTMVEKYNYIAIEGNIGAGKTALARRLSTDFKANTILEHFVDNPFLSKFYKNPKRYAFPLEISFLTERHQQLSGDLAQLNLFKNFVVSDYYIFKSLIFAQITLVKQEYHLYQKLFDLMYKTVTKPDLYVYLYRDTTGLLQNIKKRGRAYEKHIELNYLQKIHKSYTRFIKTQPSLNTLIIDISKLDFVSKNDDYQYIINKMTAL